MGSICLSEPLDLRPQPGADLTAPADRLPGPGRHVGQRTNQRQLHLRALHGQRELPAGLARRAGRQARVDAGVGGGQGRKFEPAGVGGDERLHVVEPDDGGGGVAQRLALQAEGLPGLLLVEALQLAGFGRKDGGKFGATVAEGGAACATAFGSRWI
jgi:hypothetical protein